MGKIIEFKQKQETLKPNGEIVTADDLSVALDMIGNDFSDKPIYVCVEGKVLPMVAIYVKTGEKIILSDGSFNVNDFTGGE